MAGQTELLKRVMEQSAGRGAAGDPAAGRLYGPAARADLPGRVVGGPPALGDRGPGAGVVPGAPGFE
eukprot:6985833-Alexandrium_andersonii.AAC.1